MNNLALADTAQAMVARGKGLLAMDESTGTCNRRLAEAGIGETLENRRAWREILLTAPNLGDSLSGVILVDETIRQATAGGTPFVTVARDAGLLVGIKVDTGAKALAAHASETVTEGLHGLRERLRGYAALGACFAKWRAVMVIDDTCLPSAAAIHANAHALARYAALCQEAGLVPIIEPEVLMEGAHLLARCQEVTEAVLRSVFGQLVQQGVWLEAMILKPNMVASGLACPVQSTAADVADATVRCLRRVVPAAVPGITFLSGGQSGTEASARLNAMQPASRAPWPLSFSFGRALQQPALGIWAGQAANRIAAQRALLHRARCSAAAAQGTYGAAMEAP